MPKSYCIHTVGQCVVSQGKEDKPPDPIPINQSWSVTTAWVKLALAYSSQYSELRGQEAKNGCLKSQDTQLSTVVANHKYQAQKDLSCYISLRLKPYPHSKFNDPGSRALKHTMLGHRGLLPKLDAV